MFMHTKKKRKGKKKPKEPQDLKALKEVPVVWDVLEAREKVGLVD